MAKTEKPDYLAPDHQLDVILKALKLLEYDLAGVQKMIKRGKRMATETTKLKVLTKQTKTDHLYDT